MPPCSIAVKLRISIHMSETCMNQPRTPLPGVVYPTPDEIDHYATQGIATSAILSATLRASFARHGERAALLGEGLKMSYAELDRATDAVAYMLYGLGARQHDRAVFQMSNGADLLISVIGCWKAGVIPICTLATHREAEIGYLARHGEAAFYFVQAADAKFDYPAFALRQKLELPGIRHVITGGDVEVEGATSLRRAIACVSSSVARRHVERIEKDLDPLQPVVFQISGGTTGVPKIIPRLNFEYLYNMQCIFNWTERDADEVVFCAGPMVHNAGMVVHWGPALLHGGAVVIDGGVSVEGLKNILQQHCPTWMFVPRPLLGRMKEALEGLQYEGSKVHGVVTASNAKTVRDELHLPGLHVFGMAEGLCMTTRRRDPTTSLEESIGRPVSPLDEVRIVKPGTTEPVALGDVGEMICRGPYTLKGYYNAEERNREAFTEDGFYRSGDLMSARETEGEIYYVFEGRLKDVINRAGEKISCDEIERALRDFPGLIDVALVAMPDEIYIERGCAFLCMASGFLPPTVGEIGLHLQAKGLAKFKWPERVEVIDVLPTTSSNKISKPILRQMVKEMLEAEAAFRRAENVSL
jgi:2,3-dihydroxybenzoate-AMP ligase